MNIIVTGGCGFIGSNVAAHYIALNHRVLVIDNLFRIGSERNLEWLKTIGNFQYLNHDVSELDRIYEQLKSFNPDVIFHFAGQVAMTTSLLNPELDFKTNVVGGFKVLEFVRTSGLDCAIFYSSTNKVYGDLEQFEYRETESRYIPKDYENGFNESVPLDFQSPYGCSKGATDQYFLDYKRIYGIKTVVFRHSSVFGTRQFANFDQGWVGWFIQNALETQTNSNHTFTINGSGKQVRDILFIEDLVNCYNSALENLNQTAGNAFNIGGGVENSLSLLELFRWLENKLSIKLNYTKLQERQGDQRYFVADIFKAEKLFNWKPKIGYEEGLNNMLKWIELNCGS